MTDNLKWSNYPETKPNKPGYYYTYYYNATYDQYLYKGIFYDVNNDVWILPHYKFTVKKFLEETHSNFYSDCLRKIPNLT